MSAFDPTLIQAVQRHLGDHAGTRYTDKDQIRAALETSLAKIALINGFPRELQYALAKVDLRVAVDANDVLAFGKKAIRIISGRIADNEVAAIRGLDYEWRKNEFIFQPTYAEPWIVHRNGEMEVWPVGYFGKYGFEMDVQYIPNPPDIEAEIPAIEEAMTLGAAMRIALDAGNDTLGAILMKRRDFELQSAAILPVPRSERQQEARPA